MRTGPVGFSKHENIIEHSGHWSDTIVMLNVYAFLFYVFGLVCKAPAIFAYIDLYCVKTTMFA
jgi:hypothetical protein